jgi:hypothetical protein
MTERRNNLPLRSGGTTATAEATAEAGSELARGTTLLGLLLTATVATLTGSTGATLALLTTHHAARGGVRTLLLDVGSGNNLGGKVEPLAEVVKTLGGEGVVVVLPRELGLDKAAGVQGLAGLDHVEVLGVNVAMLGKVEVLLGHEHTLAEEVLVDLLAVVLGDKHCREFQALFGESL